MTQRNDELLPMPETILVQTDGVYMYPTLQNGSHVGESYTRTSSIVAKLEAAEKMAEALLVFLASADQADWRHGESDITVRLKEVQKAEKVFASWRHTAPTREKAAYPDTYRNDLAKGLLKISDKGTLSRDIVGTLKDRKAALPEDEDGPDHTPGELSMYDKGFLDGVAHQNKAALEGGEVREALDVALKALRVLHRNGISDDIAGSALNDIQDVLGRAATRSPTQGRECKCRQHRSGDILLCDKCASGNVTTSELFEDIFSRIRQIKAANKSEIIGISLDALLQEVEEIRTQGRE